MKISKASIKDINFLFDIHNFYVSKNLFASRKKILFKDHLSWFTKNYIKKKINVIYIAHIKKKKIGYVRLEKLKDNIFEVSLALNFDFIGKGHGTKMLQKVLKIFLKNKNSAIVSKVKKKNYNSVNCFKNNNFLKVRYNSRIFNYVKNHNKFLFFKYIDNYRSTAKKNL
tara:strand:+ start:1195 stop:1701 length:507 start_codon:yes stop_codon:yes gene_type:complete